MVREFGDPFDYAIEERKIPAAAAQKIVIENFRGNARIVGTDAAEVKVSGRKTVRALQRSEADQVNGATNLDLLNQGGTIVLRTNQERGPSFDRQLSTDLEISVPKGSTIEAHGRYGDFDITGVTGGPLLRGGSAGPWCRLSRSST